MRLDSPLFAGAVLVGAIVLLWTVLVVAKRVLGARVLAAAQLTRTTVDDLAVHLIDRTGLMAVVFTVIWAVSPALALPSEWRGPLRVIAVLALTIQLAIWANAAVRFVTRRYIERTDVA